MKANELDLVELTQDLPEYGLKKGEELVVICAFSEPNEAYDLELDREDEHIWVHSVKPECFEVVFCAI